MANTGKQSPLGQNVLGGLLQNRCLRINPNAEYYMGISKSNSDYTYGQLIEGTVLRMLTWSINDGFTRQATTSLSDATYNNLISISGDGACYALGNSKPPTYVVTDPSGVWTEKSLLSAGITTLDASSLLVGLTYTIASIGDTDFTLLGAADNVVGTEFMATSNNLIVAQNFIVNLAYVIVSLATTDWETAGASSSTRFAGKINADDGNGIGSMLTVTSLRNNNPNDADFTPTNIAVGDQLWGPNSLVNGTIITEQLSGSPGGQGTYRVNIAQQVNQTDTFKTFKVGTTFNAIDVGDGTGTATQGIGTATIPNAQPGPANAGYSVEGDTDFGQSATWAPYNTANPNKSITQWGWIRCHALQAHNEFNWHATEGTENANLDSTPYPKYEDFTSSFSIADGYISSNNAVAITAKNAETFMEGTFSNMDDLITSDFSGVTKALREFGTNLKYLGKLVDFKTLDRFGFPSTLLHQLYKNGGLTQDLNLTLGAAGLPSNRIRAITKNETQATVLEEKQIYSAMIMMTGENLINCISPMTTFVDLLLEQNVSFPIRTLADCLDVKRLFNLQDVWSTLTVPVYNTTTSLPTGTKTYYLIYNTDGSVNGALNTTAVKTIVGTLIPAGTPPTNATLPDEYSVLPEGFDSYLGGPNVVIPTEIGLAAAAFRYTMLQISNIEQIQPGSLGGCISGLELNVNNGAGANGTEGSPTSLAKPVNDELAVTVAEEVALGTGYAGTYTFSDFFGCMSGLPYAWNVIYKGINQTGATQEAQQSNLAKIYQQLFLAVTWEVPVMYPIIATSITADAIENGEDYVIVDPGDTDFVLVGAADNVSGTVFTSTGGLQTAGGFDTGTVYTIVSVGDTDFTAVGAGSNTIGIRFTATGSGSGTGVAKTIVASTGTGIVAPTGTYNVTGWNILKGGGYLRANADDPTISVTGFPSATVTIGNDDTFAGSNNTGTFGRVASISNATGSTSTFPVATVQEPPSATYTFNATNGVNGGTIDFDTVVQNYIDEANAEIINIVDPAVGYPGGVDELNMAWDVLGRQLAVEQRTRYNALTPVEIPRDPFINSNQNLVTFVDSIPTYAEDVRPHMSAQTIEMILDRDCEVAQNIVAMMRQERNQTKLTDCGIPMNNNISDIMDDDIVNSLLTNNTVPGAITGIGPIGDIGATYTNPAWPIIEVDGGDGDIGSGSISPAGQFIDGIFYPMSCIEIGTYFQFLQGNPYPQVGALINCGTVDGPTQPFLGSLLNIGGGGIPSSPGTVVIGPPETPTFSPGTIPTGQPTVEEAIEQVILCNCDCWDLIT